MNRQQFFLLILLAVAHVVGAQVTPKHIRNFGPEVTRSGEVAQSVTISEKGIPYFGTEKGVLSYEGDRWTITPLTDDSGVRSLEYDTVRHRLWVGGVGTFGYIACDASEQYRYVSISDSIFKAHPFKQVWQILIEPNKVTFMTNEAHYEWNEHHVEWKDIKVSFVFSVDGTKYYSQRDGALSIEEDNQLVPVWDQSGVREGVYFLTSLDSANHLLFTPYHGVFRYERQKRKVVPFHSPIDSFLKTHAFYDAWRANDSLIAIGTWYDGVVLATPQGEIVDRFGTNKGMSSDGISDLQMDPYGKLWVATDYGISMIDFASSWPRRFTQRKSPIVLPLQLTINNDSSIFINCANEEIVLHRLPQQLRFRLGVVGVDLPVARKIEARLEGYDDDWRSLETLEQEYTNLRNGDYKFMTRFADQPKEGAGSVVFIQIRQPWYQPLADVWDYVILSFVFVALLVSAFTYRLRASKRALKHMVAEKTREIERHERELIQINASLQQANEELDILLYRSSHDLISPVKSIKGLLNLIRLSPDEQATYLSLMEDRIIRLEHILVELNSYVRNAKGELHLSPVPIRNLCNEVWHELEFMETALKMELQLKVDDSLVLETDRGRLKIIVGNLVANAVKYADVRKTKPSISIEAFVEAGFFVLRISDNGQGIRSEHKARLFEMFFRASERSDGIGLGLFLVKKMVDSLSGSIVIDSQFGEWTKVEVKIPLPKSTTT